MNKLKIIALMTIAIISGSSQAALGVTASSGTGLQGATVTINIALISSTNVNFQFRLNYDNTNLTATPNCAASIGDANITCTVNAAGYITILGASAGNIVLPSGTLGTIDFAIGGAAPVAIYPLSISNEVYSEGPPAFTGLTSDSSSNGQVTVQAAPAPIFTSNPADTVALTTINVVQNFGTQTSNLVISNTGNAEPLTGSCSLTTNPSSAFSLSGTGTPSFSVLMGGTDTDTVTVACDNTLPVAAYNGVLTCTSNGGADTTYPLVCNVTAPGPAVYGDPSSPPAAPVTTNLTMTSGPLLGGSTQTVTGQDLVISNTAGLGNNNLEIISCTESAVPEVTVANPIAANTMIAPGASAPAVTFACDVSGAPAAVNTFSKTYTCDYSTDGVTATVEGTAVYTYTCDTRAAASAGSPANATMTNANITAPPGGSNASTVLTISETLNEGADLTAVSCSLNTGTDFVLTAVPATIASGTSQAIEVTFTDPGMPGPYTDTLTCMYTDSAVTATVTVNLTGAVQAIIVPALSYIGYAAMMLGLLFVGFFGFRRRA